MTVERTNEQWLADLTSEDATAQAAALDDLRVYLRRGILYYLSHERSDLAELSGEELRQMAEDFSQDATLRILDNIESFRGDSRFTTWAMKIGTRTAISELRRARYKDFSLDELTADGEFMLNVESGDSNSQTVSPERATEQVNVLQIIQQALDEVLTERQKAALEAVTLRGVPMDIVAEQMGTNRNALYKLLHDARKKLRTHLESQGIVMGYVFNLFQE
ncbi:MAG: sigma-70 family RNA polymerase sigma factor [Chloroflexi bacterium]|nr:sigma-70 family RNA polymerase sigma factor [Chloroflexota bacterium]